MPHPPLQWCRVVNRSPGIWGGGFPSAPSPRTVTACAHAVPPRAHVRHPLASGPRSVEAWAPRSKGHPNRGCKLQLPDQMSCGSGSDSGGGGWGVRARPAPDLPPASARSGVIRWGWVLLGLTRGTAGSYWALGATGDSTEWHMRSRDPGVVWWVSVECLSPCSSVPWRPRSRGGGRLRHKG